MKINAIKESENPGNADINSLPEAVVLYSIDDGLEENESGELGEVKDVEEVFGDIFKRQEVVGHVIRKSNGPAII